MDPFDVSSLSLLPTRRVAGQERIAIVWSGLFCFVLSVFSRALTLLCRWREEMETSRSRHLPTPQTPYGKVVPEEVLLTEQFQSSMRRKPGGAPEKKEKKPLGNLQCSVIAFRILVSSLRLDFIGIRMKSDLDSILCLQIACPVPALYILLCNTAPSLDVQTLPKAPFWPRLAIHPQTHFSHFSCLLSSTDSQ